MQNLVTQKQDDAIVKAMFSSLIHANGALLLECGKENGKHIWRRVHRSEESWRKNLPIWEEIKADKNMGVGFRMPVWMKGQRKDLYLIQTPTVVVKARAAVQEGEWKGLKLIERGEASWREILWLFEHSCGYKHMEKGKAEGVFLAPLLFHNFRHYAERDIAEYEDALCDMININGPRWEITSADGTVTKAPLLVKENRKAMLFDAVLGYEFISCVHREENNVWSKINPTLDRKKSNDGILLSFFLYDKKEKLYGKRKKQEAWQDQCAYGIADELYILDTKNEKLYHVDHDGVENDISVYTHYEMELRTIEQECGMDTVLTLYVRNANAHAMGRILYVLFLLYREKMDEEMYLKLMEEAKDAWFHVD